MTSLSVEDDDDMMLKVEDEAEPQSTLTLTRRFFYSLVTYKTLLSLLLFVSIRISECCRGRFVFVAEAAQNLTKQYRKHIIQFQRVYIYIYILATRLSFQFNFNLL